MTFICRQCGDETDRESKARPGEGFCNRCLKRLKRKRQRAARREAMESLGMTRVRGNLGGEYWE